MCKPDSLAGGLDGGSDRPSHHPAHRAPADRIERFLPQLLAKPPEDPMPLAQDQLMLALELPVIPAGVDHPIPPIRARLRP